ncbi:MAG: hypothetical protein V1678_04415 [Candidatus Aenigmatarchaeota archaeon]
MAEEKVRSWIPKFQEELKLEPGIARGFASVYERLLQSDRKNIEPNDLSYPAAIAYVSNLVVKSKKSQKEIAAVTKCSAQNVSNKYREIVVRNRKIIIELSS